MSGKEAVVTTDGNPRGPRTTRGRGGPRRGCAKPLANQVTYRDMLQAAA